MLPECVQHQLHAIRATEYAIGDSNADPATEPRPWLFNFKLVLLCTADRAAVTRMTRTA